MSELAKRLYSEKEDYFRIWNKSPFTHFSPNSNFLTFRHVFQSLSTRNLGFFGDTIRTDFYGYEDNYQGDLSSRGIEREYTRRANDGIIQ